MDSLLCPWKKEALTFSLNSTHLIGTPSNTDTFYGPLRVHINQFDCNLRMGVKNLHWTIFAI